MKKKSGWSVDIDIDIDQAYLLVIEISES